MKFIFSLNKNILKTVSIEYKKPFAHKINGSNNHFIHHCINKILIINQQTL